MDCRKIREDLEILPGCNTLWLGMEEGEEEIVNQ